MQVVVLLCVVGAVVWVGGVVALVACGVLGGEGILGWPLVAARQQGSSAVLASLCRASMLAALVSTTATLCVSPPFLCVWRLLPSSWFSSASSVLRSLSSVLYLGPSLFPCFLSLVLGLLEQLPLAFSSA